MPRPLDCFVLLFFLYTLHVSSLRFPSGGRRSVVDNVDAQRFLDTGVFSKRLFDINIDGLKQLDAAIPEEKSALVTVRQSSTGPILDVDVRNGSINDAASRGRVDRMAAWGTLRNAENSTGWSHLNIAFDDERHVLSEAIKM
eukprot:GHVS01071395.1.p1 GENE.GHVS01071395.1~~GHVS01071395.1.p1  ORF type:complete len:142 (-),score=8.46 GHVS01071395.1:191-616(-)